MKRAIQVNSEKAELIEVQIGDDFREIYPFIGENCTTFECPIMCNNQDTFYVDEEGLYQGYKYGFQFSDFPTIILGNALILGTDMEGNSVDCKSSIDELKKQIKFFVIAN